MTLNNIQDSQRCFQLPSIAIEPPNKNVQQWINTYAHKHIAPQSDSYSESLARILPFLHCGEQSAIGVFSNELMRLNQTNANLCLSTLTEIINDEYYHDELLQHVISQLPTSLNVKQNKKRARLFYARLGNQHQISTHFQMIAELDAKACHILHAMEHSKLGSNHPINQLFQLIKKDEARHVHYSKQRASQLGIKCKFNIGKQLVELLSTEANTFEHLGVDFDKLSKRLLIKESRCLEAVA